MVAWLGRLFGTEEASKKVVEGLYNGIDKLVYTDEEKSDRVAQDRSEARNMFIRWVESTQGSNLSRRLIALVVTGIWALQYVISMIMFAFAPWLEDPTQILASAQSISNNGESVTGAMMLVLAFYFAAPNLGKVVDTAMNKFSKPSGTSSNQS